MEKIEEYNTRRMEIKIVNPENIPKHFSKIDIYLEYLTEGISVEIVLYLTHFRIGILDVLLNINAKRKDIGLQYSSENNSIIVKIFDYMDFDISISKLLSEVMNISRYINGKIEKYIVQDLLKGNNND